MSTLLIHALAAQKEPTVEKVREILTPVITGEEDIDRSMELQEYLGRPTASPLAEAVIQADPEARESWLQSLADQYISDVVEPFIQSLNSPEVAQMRIGEDETSSVTIYICGGLSDGKSPSPVFDLWLDVIEADENPYGRELFNSCFIELKEPFLPQTNADVPFISGVEISSKPRVTPPF